MQSFRGYQVPEGALLQQSADESITGRDTHLHTLVKAVSMITHRMKALASHMRYSCMHMHLRSHKQQPHRNKGSVCSLSTPLKAAEPALQFTLEYPQGTAHALCEEPPNTHSSATGVHRKLRPRTHRAEYNLQTRCCSCTTAAQLLPALQPITDQLYYFNKVSV